MKGLAQSSAQALFFFSLLSFLPQAGEPLRTRGARAARPLAAVKRSKKAPHKLPANAGPLARCRPSTTVSRVFAPSSYHPHTPGQRVGNGHDSFISIWFAKSYGYSDAMFFSAPAGRGLVRASRAIYSDSRSRTPAISCAEIPAECRVRIRRSPCGA